MKTINRTSVLVDVESDMKALYKDFSSGSIQRDAADSLANIAGKRLKAVQLDLADEIFRNHGVPLLPKDGR